MLLLSVKKIRERENEMLIQARNSLQSKRVAASENELDAMLRSMEKQVSSAFCTERAFKPHFIRPLLTSKLFTVLEWDGSLNCKSMLM